jgi:hypothetical protein
MVEKKKEIDRCEICLQPTAPDYKFDLSYIESGKKVTKYFCGSVCLKRWVETEIDKLHLDLYSLEEVS